VYDIALLDINLGEKRTGSELLQQFRSIPGKSPFYAVAFTAYALPTDRAQFMTQGFDDYLAKPFTKSDLLEVLHRSTMVHPV
jgi:CheY-like chemotaxis protein